MKDWLLVAAAVMVAVPLAAQSVAYKLTAIDRTPSREWKNVETSFSRMLPTLDERCADRPSQERVADSMVTAWQELGGHPKLINFAEELFGLTGDLDVVARIAKMPFECGEAWGMYVILRKKGYPAADARESITEIYRSIFALAQ